MSGNENYQDWQDVLVQWVNCLGLQGSSVTNIKELGDGRLFTSLLKILTNEPACEVTTDKANENAAVFLKNEYPKFCMDTDPCEMEDEIGITYLTSLLLFHSVVRCKNENLVSQMFSLNQDVQSYITHFLQSMLEERNVTKTTLKTAIHSYKKSSPPRTPNQRYQFTVFSPTFESPTNGPPLKEIYRSPLAQKTKELSEKRLEIRRLNEELENEQKAKFELQDQLHKHQEKTKQLVLQLNEKNNEIKELRDYWVRCDCESKSKSLEELSVQEKTLKKELKHLETYSSAVETELGTFRIDNEFLQQRLAKAEKQCALWQTKSEEYQSACQKLQNDIEEKEVELSRTKELCSELQSHIEELRFHKQTSIEEDISQSWSPSSPVSIPENAADAVVEVQLSEMVEENKKLNQQIAAMRLEEGAMTEQIADLECRLEIACQQSNSLKASNIELEKKVDMMISIQHDLEETKMKLNNATIELDHLYREETLLRQQKEGLQDLLACKDLELLELKKSNESLSNNFADLQQRFEETQKILVTETERIVKLQREALEAQKVWQSLESVDEKLKEEVILVERILLLNKTSDQALTLQDCIPCSGDDQQEKGAEESLSAVCLSVKAKVQKLNYLLTDLNANNVESLNVRSHLESTCQQLNEHIKKLQDEILELESKEQDQLIKNSQLRECLQKADKNIDSLQMKVSEYTDKIEKLSAILEDKKNIVEKLESIKKNLTAKISALEEENSSTKVKLQEIRCELTEVKEDKIQLEDVYNKLLNRSEEQAREVNRLNSVIEELDLQLKELKEEKDFSTCKIEELTKKLLEVQASKDSLEKMYDIAVKENELSMTQLKRISEQLKNRICELEERIKISDQEIIVLNNNLEELNNEKEILKQQYNDEIQKKDEHIKLLSDKVGLLKISISKLEEEKQTADSEYETLQIKLTGKLAQKDVEVEELNRSLIEKNEAIDKLQIKMQNEIKKLADEKEILSNTLESTKNKLVEVLANKDQLERLFEEQKQDYSKELAIVTDKVSTLTRQLEEMLQGKEVMHAELEQKNCELTNIQGNYETLQEETNQLEVLTVQQREELKNCAAEIEDLIEKRKSVVSELEVTKTELSKEKEYKNALLEALSKKDKCLLSATEETEKLHTKLTLIEEQRDSLQDAVQKLTSELDVAETTKAKLLESYSASKLENENIKKLKLELEEKVSLLENEKKSIHTALNVAKSDLILHKQQEEETLTAHNREIAELKKEILKLTHKATTLQEEIDALECDKKKLVLNLESAKSEVSELKSQNKHLCESNNKLKTENEELESVKLFLDDKIKQLVQDKSSVNEEIGYVKASLQALEENKDQLVKKYKKELDAKEEKINELSKERDKLQKSLEQTNEEKNILDRNLCLAKSELHEVTVTKDELLKAHAKQIQETEENIKTVHKNALEVKAMLLKKVEEVEEERNTEKKLRERVELLLHQEKSNMESVLAQRNALVSEKELISKFCADFRSNICSLRETIAALEDRTKQGVKCEVDSMQNANDSPESENSVTDSLHVLYDSKKKIPSKPWNLDHYETVNFPNCNLSSKSSEHDSNWSDSTASQNSGLLKQTVPLKAEQTEKKISTSETNSEEDSDAKWSEVVKKLKELNTELNAARGEVIGVLKSNDILRTKLSITEKRCTDIAQKYSSMTLNNDILKSENEKLVKGIEGLSNLKTVLEESEKDFANERRLKAKIKSELEDLELSYTTLKTDFDKQTATNISLNTAVKDMNNKLNILYEQNKDLNQKVKEYEQCHLKIEEASLKLKRIQQMSDLEFENVFGSVQALRQIISNFQKSLKNVSNKFECLVLECTINCDELQEIEKHKNSLENLYLLLQIECDVLSQDVLKFTYTCLKETKPDKVLESTEFEQNIELREQQIKDLEFQIGALISGIEVAMMECSRLETKCDMLKDLQLTQPTEMQDLATLTSGDRIDLIKNILSRLEISEKTQSEQDIEEDCWNPEDSLEMQETAQMKESKHSALLKLRFQLGEIKALQEQNNALSTKLFSEQNTKQQLSKCLADIRETNEKLVSENNILSKLKNVAEEKLSKQFQETNELKQAFETLLEDNYKLKSEIDERKNKLIRMEAQMEEKIKAVRQEYEMKLDRLKAKMRVLYDEEIEKKMKKSREESEQLQTLCKDYKDKIKSCHEEINFQRSHIWELMDKLVLSENEKKQLNEEILKLKDPLFERLDSGRPTDRKTRTCSREINTMDVIDESVTYVRRRKSIQQNIPSGMGLMFDPEDEEGEVFNTTNLADLKAGRCIPTDQDSNYKGRISELQYRNSLCPPHLKSSYPAETQFHDPRVYRDEDLKLGCAVDVENLDTQSTSMLLPGEKPRKKDRGQTSYKKPGPPTPGKNGGRLSLQGTEVLTPRAPLRESNDGACVRKASTPGRLKSLFGTKHRQDENTPVTPRGRRLSNFFRRQVTYSAAEAYELNVLNNSDNWENISYYEN